MLKKNKRRDVLLLSGLAAIILVVGGVWLRWDHIRFWWLFEPLGKNPHGYPEYRHRQTGIVMVQLPGGTFWMGAQADDPTGPNYDPDTDMAGMGEWLVHEVSLSPFLIGKYEVTQRQWKAVMGSNPSEFVDDNRPVETVSWDELHAENGFLERTSLRLPTEAQWEFACRAGKGRPVGSGVLDDMACYDDKETPDEPIRFTGAPSPRRGSTLPVGTKKPNEFGLYDMLGNVWEWCEDKGDTLFYRQSAGARDPLCTEGWQPVFRGGSWENGAGECRCSHRKAWRPGGQMSSLGFRVAYYPVP